MPSPITNPQAIAFCNNEARPSFDDAITLYWTAKRIIADWTALSMSSLIANDTSPVMDGASTDGRPLITGANVNILIANLTTFVTSMEATSNLLFNQYNVGNVNGKSSI